MNGKAESPRARVITLLHGSAFLWAFLTSLLGPVLALMIRDFDAPYAAGGALFSASSFGFMAGSVFGGSLADRLDRRVLFLGSFLALFLVFGSVAAAPVYWVVLGAMAVGGIAGGLLTTLANSGIGDLFVEGRASALNLLNVTFGLGAVVAPLYATGVLALGGGWRPVYALTVVPVVGLFVLGVLTRPPRNKGVSEGDVRKAEPNQTEGGGEQEGRMPPWAPYLRLLRKPRIVVFAVGVFLAAGVEWGMSVWVVTYSTERTGLGSAMANNTLALFWGGMLVGRLLMSRVLTRWDPLRILPLVVLGGVAASVLALSGLTPLASVAGTASLGLLLGGVLPTLIGSTMDASPGLTGSVSGLLMFASGLGSLTVPGLIGIVSDAAGLGWGMALIPAWMGALLVLVVVQMLWRRDYASSSSPETTGWRGRKAR